MRLLLVLLLLTQAAHAAEVQASVDRAQTEMGRTVTLTLDVTAESEPPPPEKLDFPPFETRDAVLTPLPPNQQGRRWRYTVRLAAYEAGELTVPAFEFAGARSQPIRIKVEPAPPDPKGEIRDLKPPPPASLPAWLYGAVLAAVLGLAAVATWIARRPGSPRKRALRELNTLQGAAPEAQVTRAAAILRRFMRLPEEKTTSELAPDLPPPARQVLESADLVKFARHRPGNEEGLQAVQAARQIVEHAK